MNEIFAKIKNKESFSETEIKDFVDGYTKGKISDEEAEKIIRYIYINGMSEKEIFYLTKAMAKSGEIFSWKDSLLIDKHSTGGVGDKLTLILMPILAEIGFKSAKMSGRSLGLTGGTADKLESIKGMNIDLTKQEFKENVNKNGIAIMTQTKKIAPADKKIYALRDKKGLTDSIPLIASSIMSKKIALGCKNLILDVTFGSGAFMKDTKNARKLAKLMVKIGEKFNIKTLAAITNMEEPLGHTIGNRLEVLEAFNVLNGEKGRIRDLAVDISYLFIQKYKEELIKEGNRHIANITKQDIENIIDSKRALKKFENMLKMQGVYADEILKLNKEKDGYNINGNIKKINIYANEDFEILKIDAHIAAKCSFMCGSGKNKEDEKIEYNAGIIYEKLSGEKINKGDLLGKVYISKNKLEKKEVNITEIEELFRKSIIKKENNLENKYKYIEIYESF